MFDFAWSEIALIGVVALVLIGPKDMPVAIKAVSTMVKKARRMAAEFQTHVDDMLKDADMNEVREHIRDIRSLDIRGSITRAIDRDGSIRDAFKDPMREPPPPAVPDTAPTVVETLPEHSIAALGSATEAPPSFIPPEMAAAEPAPPPAFIPPETVRPAPTSHA